MNKATHTHIYSVFAHNCEPNTSPLDNGNSLLVIDAPPARRRYRRNCFAAHSTGKSSDITPARVAVAAGGAVSLAARVTQAGADFHASVTIALNMIY